MPTTPTFPGVYIEEIASGVRTITGVATSITAFVGYTARGPVNKAIRISSFGDYERTFGGLQKDSEIGYAVQQFFLNGGTDAYVVRVAQSAGTAQVTLRYAPGQDALIVRAASAGAWGNNVRLDVDYNTSNPDSTFNLTVTRYEFQNTTLVAVEQEQHRNLSMNSGSGTYAINVVNSASNLIQLTRAPGMTFSDSGYSLSGKLGTALPASTSPTVLAGILDGRTPFTLQVAAYGTGVGAALTAVNNAIGAAGLPARLTAGQANADGTPNATGDYLQLKSTATTEASSVQIIAAPSNDAAPALKLGVGYGGREKEGASSRRPLPTGTLGGDLSSVLNTSVNSVDTPLTVTINDLSTGSPVPIASGTVTVPANTVVGPALRDTLQSLIRSSISDPSAQQATVQLSGPFLRIVPSAGTPNAQIVFTNGSSGTLADALRLSATPGGAVSNVQQYSLGVGVTAVAQAGSSPGADGAAPTSAAPITGDYGLKTGIYALRDVDLFNLLVIPRTTQLPDTDAKTVLTAAIALCEERRAFFLVDPDPTRTLSTIGDWAPAISTSKNAAIYFPQILVADPLDGFRLHNMPASGAIAGLFARTDSDRGVWKAPAGTDAVLRGVQGLSYTLTDQENGRLNPLAVNCLRNFPVYGKVVWGARTMNGDDRQASEYKYIPVRRTALLIEESLYRGTQWVVFEPNDEPLWAQIRLNIGAFMHNLFRQGAFQGKSPREAYFVKCDGETTTQNDINLGIVNIVVGFAPLKPAEFVIIKLQQMAGQIAA